MAAINEVFIVTGCSRGLGAALFQQARRPDRLLLGIARQPCTGSLAGDPADGDHRQTWRVDLGNAAEVAERLHDWLLNHRIFGRAIQDWRNHSAIRPRAKRMALLAMAAALGLSVVLGLPMRVLVVQAVALLVMGSWIWTRPDGPAS